MGKQDLLHATAVGTVWEGRSGRISRRAPRYFCRGRPGACPELGEGCGPQAAGAHIGAPLHDLKQLILEKTEGTPFFMEEVVQDVSGRRGAQRRAWPVPAGARASRTPYLPHRARRLGRPHRPPRPDEKTLLQQLSVIGRQFPLSLLRQVIPHPEDELYRLLASLQHKEFLYEQPALPEADYIFKHALTQEVAYGTVLHERAQSLT